MQSKYYVTRVSNEKDLNQTLSIWDRNLPLSAGHWMDKYNWFYETNPYRKGKLWLLKLEGNEKAVGVAGVGYSNFSVRGEYLMGAKG